MKNLRRLLTPSLHFVRSSSSFLDHEVKFMFNSSYECPMEGINGREFLEVYPVARSAVFGVFLTSFTDVIRIPLAAVVSVRICKY